MLRVKHDSGESRLHYGTVSLDDVPKGRRGKHFAIIQSIMQDLGTLPKGSALKIPLNSLKGQKLVNVRSAVNRATRARNLHVATSTDSDFFYVWRK